MAGEHTLIKKIMSGEDVHTATATLMGIDRQKAKILNFALLYGAGAKKLAIMLKTTEPEAKRLKTLYFSSLPKISQFVENVKKRAEARGYIFNYAGRRLYFPKFEKDGEMTSFSYASPNHLIQGAGSEIMRTALIDVDAFLAPYESKILLSVHDEILLEIHESEMHLIPEIRKLMADAYSPVNGCYMGTSVEYGKSWGSLKELQSEQA
jgi:DNA polymerase-1